MKISKISCRILYVKIQQICNSAFYINIFQNENISKVFLVSEERLSTTDTKIIFYWPVFSFNIQHMAVLQLWILSLNDRTIIIKNSKQKYKWNKKFYTCRYQHCLLIFIERAHGSTFGVIILWFHNKPKKFYLITILQNQQTFRKFLTCLCIVPPVPISYTYAVFYYQRQLRPYFS